MKLKFFFVLGLCATLFTQYSCSNEVEVIGIWKDIPVVYGVINHEDSINYIRVERAYLPPNQSAYDVARIPDSLYFDTMEVDVTLQFLLNGDTLDWTPALEYVNLVDEGIVRDSGIFANNPAYAYKMRGKGSVDLLLKIENHKTGNTFYAHTETTVATTNPTFPNDIILNPLYSIGATYRPIKWRDLNSQGDEIFTQVQVEVLRNFASIYDYKVRFHYDEYNVDGLGVEIAGTRVDKSVEWRAVGDFVPLGTNQTKRNISGEAFYQFLASNLSDVTGTNLRRCSGYLEIYVDGASASLKDYINARQANEGFVGGLYPADPYSNVEGGFGVFATRDRLERRSFLTSPRLMEMSNLSRKYLMESTVTNKLGFESDQPCY